MLYYGATYINWSGQTVTKYGEEYNALTSQIARVAVQIHEGIHDVKQLQSYEGIPFGHILTPRKKYHEDELEAYKAEIEFIRKISENVTITDPREQGELTRLYSDPK